MYVLGYWVIPDTIFNPISFADMSINIYKHFIHIDVYLECESRHSAQQAFLQLKRKLTKLALIHHSASDK
jgi:hypothetical protein